MIAGSKFGGPRGRPGKLMKLRKPGLVPQILAGVVLGAAAGVLVPGLAERLGLLGQLFVGMLKAVAPLLVATPPETHRFPTFGRSPKIKCPTHGPPTRHSASRLPRWLRRQPNHLPRSVRPLFVREMSDLSPRFQRRNK